MCLIRLSFIYCKFPRFPELFVLNFIHKVSKMKIINISKLHRILYTITNIRDHFISSKKFFLFYIQLQLQFLRDLILFKNKKPIRNWSNRFF
jgi:hypothetical protein